MDDLSKSIAVIRESVVAVLRVRRVIDPANPALIQFQHTWGTGFCITDDRFVLTAAHNLGDRDPSWKMFACAVPQNGSAMVIFPVVGIVLDRPDVDIAALEIGKPLDGHVSLPALPVTFQPFADGTRVATVGFPSPQVARIAVDAAGEFAGGEFFLKSHANEGILAAQYIEGPAATPTYEFNVGWHHGESGGPVATVSENPAALTLMQHYRNIDSPHGVAAGPHRGLSLSVVAAELRALGARVVGTP